MWIKKKTHKHFGAARGHMPHPKTTPPPPKCCRTEDPKVKNNGDRIRRTVSQKKWNKTLQKKIAADARVVWGLLFVVVVASFAEKKSKKKNEKSLFLLYFVSLFLYTSFPHTFRNWGARGREREREREASFSNWREHATGRKEERKEKHEDTYTPFFRAKSGYVWKSCCCCCWRLIKL